MKEYWRSNSLELTKTYVFLHKPTGVFRMVFRKLSQRKRSDTKSFSESIFHVFKVGMCIQRHRDLRV